MQARQVAFGVLLLVVGGALLVGTGYGLGTLGSETVAESNESDEQFGHEVTSFAQSSAVEAERAVEGGMWNAAINVSDLPEDAVRDRTQVLENRLVQLEERRTGLAADRENMSAIAYTAQASQVRVEIANVRSAVNQTRQTAIRHGVDDVTALERLQRDARNMTGPDIAAAARNITDTPRGPPGHAGPPAGVGPPTDGNESNHPGDRQVGPPTDGNESDHPGNGPLGPPTDGNDSDRPGNGNVGPPTDNNEMNGNGTNGPGGGPSGPPTDGNESDHPGNGQAGPPTDDASPGDANSSNYSQSAGSDTDHSDDQSDRGERDADEPGKSDDNDAGPPDDREPDN